MTMTPMTGDLDGNTSTFTCALCDMDITGRAHATAMVAHALDECRHRLRDQRDEMKKDRQVAVTAMLKVWSALDDLDLNKFPAPARESKETLRKALNALGIEPA
jgi:hypothetical protein